jgi:hypothetical protein
VPSPASSAAPGVGSGRSSDEEHPSKPGGNESFEHRHGLS